MSDRDELMKVILGQTIPKAVERILAAGYSKPRTITTVAELDALPENSVVLDGMGTVALQIGAGLWSMDGYEYTSVELVADSILPATVLYSPAVTK
jgi:hypothetical protein